MLVQTPHQQTSTPTTPVVLKRQTEAPRISGHKIARLAAGKSQAERAAVAANLYLRGFAIQNPTIKQLAALRK